MFDTVRRYRLYKNINKNKHEKKNFNLYPGNLILGRHKTVTFTFLANVSYNILVCFAIREIYFLSPFYYQWLVLLFHVR